jgi:hypothetical protein
LPKIEARKIRGEIWDTSPALGENLQKSMSPELARVYELQKTGTTLVPKLIFYKIISKNYECLEHSYP